MKQQLSEALAWYADMTYLDEKDAPMVAAARLVERLLPGECENCGGTGIAGVHRHIKQSTGEHLGDQDVPCGFCDNGQVWDEGIVEAVAGAIEKHYAPQWLDPVELADMARAVLSALVELLTEKEERLVVTLHNDTQVADRPVLESIEGVDPSEYSIELSTQPSRLPE